MKATHTLDKDGTPVMYMVVKFQITANEIEYYAQELMQSGNMKPSMKAIKKSMSNSLALSGEAAFDGVLWSETLYKTEAHEYCKQMFPSFYK